MGQLEDILKHQNMVRNNIMKSFGAETSEDSLEKSFEDEVNPFEMEAYKSELTKAELDEFEKAKHQDGDMHPNGKWVWRQSANGGKGDWRVAKPGGSKATTVGAFASKTTSSSYFSKLSNSLIEKYSNKKESVSLSDIEEFYEDFLRDRSQEPTRKVYANEAKKTYDAIVANWNKQKTKTASTNTTTSKTTSADKREKKIIANQVEVDKVFNQMSKFLKTKKIDGFELWADKNNWNEFYNKFDDKLRKLGFSIGRNYKKSLYWNIYSKDSDFNDSVASVSTDNDLSSLRKKIKDLMDDGSKTKSPDSENTSKKNDPSTIEEAISLVSKNKGEI